MGLYLYMYIDMYIYMHIHICIYIYIYIYSLALCRAAPGVLLDPHIGRTAPPGAALRPFRIISLDWWIKLQIFEENLLSLKKV